MKNLSALSKIHYANYAHIVVVMLGMTMGIIFVGFSPITFGFALANLVIAFYAYTQIKIVSKSINDTTDVIKSASSGRAYTKSYSRDIYIYKLSSARDK
jgi:hypothetical protein